MYNPNDTIVARSTGPFAGGSCHLGRAILRLSGPQALRIATALLPQLAAAGPGWRRVLGEIRWRERPVAAAAYVMPGPRSYTRQDVVELHLPAIRPLLGEVLERLAAEGARLALPGEFTRRALLHGRITIAQAEAVGALVRSHAADEARALAAQAGGTGATRAAALRTEVQELLALVELGLDFSQEDVETISPEEIARRLRRLAAQAEVIVGSARDGEGLRPNEEPRVVLAGPSNAGKSLLFNRLAGREAALVSDQAHTTRDPLEAVLDVGCRLLLTDTAGFARRAGATVLDRAVDASVRAIRSADLLLLAYEPGRVHDPEEWMRLLEALLPGAKPETLVLWMKSDLPVTEESLARASAWKEDLALRHGISADALAVSGLTSEGLTQLRARLAEWGERFRVRVAAARNRVLAAACEAARSASKAIVRAQEALESRQGEDVLAMELRGALHALSQGEGVLLRHDALTEALLDRIFSGFCIGK